MPRKTISSEAVLVKSLLGLKFKKEKLLLSAIYHPSYRNEMKCPKLDDFDRLEFFGDSILNYVICRKLYKVFPDANEGLMSRLRSTLVSRKVLCRISRDVKLTKLIHVGRSLRNQKELGKSKIISDCFEALIAALYFDQGMDKTERFILKHMTPYFCEKRLLRLDPNPKSVLQELTLKQWQKLPKYKCDQTPDGIKTIIALDTRRKASALGKTRRESEEKAARLLITKIRKELAQRAKKRPSGKKLRKLR